MKRKAVEKIPYMKPERKKDCKYAARATVISEKDSKILIIDFYGAQDVPKRRFVIAKNDYETFYPEKGKWTKKGIIDPDASWSERQGKNYSVPRKDLEKIEDFAGKSYVTDWISKLDAMQGTIRNEKRSRALAKRSVAIAERAANTPELPEEVKKWAEDTLMPRQHRLFYKRKGTHIVVCCSACGKITEGRCKESDYFPKNLERLIEPCPGSIGECPKCKAEGIWKSLGRAKEEEIRVPFYVGMPYKDTGALIRYCECIKVITPPKDLYGKAQEKTGVVEQIRQYMYNGKIQKDYNKCFCGESFWDDVGYSAYGPRITAESTYVYPGTWDLLKGTCLQYSGAKEYIASGKGYLMRYMQKYIEMPQIEMASKLGLRKLAEELAIGYCRLVNEGATNIRDFLGIKKERLKMLQKKEGDTELLKVMRLERTGNANWTEDQIEFLAMIHIVPEELAIIDRYIGMQRFINHCEKYAGITVKRCFESYGKRKMQDTAKTYLDYLRMRSDAGYDMHNTVYLYPKHLETVHNEMVVLQNERLRQSREGQAEKSYPNIAKFYEKLSEYYYYEDDKWLIRPAKSATEIIEEGRKMHHCVGGPYYLNKHNTGESIILLMRSKGKPDEPYVTIEIAGTMILQWYQKNDKKPDAAVIDPWLKNYTKTLEEKNIWAMCS